LGEFSASSSNSRSYLGLGFIISETDSYQYHGRETATEKNNIHLKILAFYTKWITNVARSTYFGENGKDEAGPSTACIVFSPTQPFQTVAVPCAVSELVSSTESRGPGHTTRKPPKFHRWAGD
jgi:hypothetical protein